MSTLGDRVREAATTLEEFDSYYDAHGVENRAAMEGWLDDLADALRSVIKAWELS